MSELRSSNSKSRPAGDSKPGMYRLHDTCRACSGTNLTKVFDLGIQPLANDFAFPHQRQAGYAPLEVMVCKDCQLAQLSVVVDPEILYSQYNYVTSHSKTMQAHMHKILEDIREEQPLGNMVEIGSNDGYFLKIAKEAGWTGCMGIDPAANLRIEASEKGIATICSMWNGWAAARLREWNEYVGEKPTTFVARHVFCHVDNWKDFIATLESVAYKDSLVCIEAPYVVDTLQNVEFDQIYHEHLSFLSIRALTRLLEKTSFHVHKVLHYPIHGGSVMVMLRHNDYEKKPHVSVDAFLAGEVDLGVAAWTEFANKADAKIRMLHGIVEELVLRQQKKVVGCGASAKSTVWINAAGIRKWIRFITDTTPQKIGKFSPGTTIPIVSEDKLMDEGPHYAILFAWNFQEEMLEKHAGWRATGGRFIIPCPKLEIV